MSDDAATTSDNDGLDDSAIEAAIEAALAQMYACHVLEWTYSPSDFFGEPVELTRIGCEIKIESGKIEAKVQPDHYPQDHSLRDTLQMELDARFQAVQVLTHRPFELSRSNLTSIEKDGRKHRRMFADCGSYLMVGQRAIPESCG